jgi:hypothetical protein
MAELKNELRWSHTRQRNWDTCRRLYYLAHYAHWNGWRRGADELTRRCYILTKMVNLPMLAGEVVHRVVEKILRDHQAGHSRSIDAWVAEARRLLNEGWRQSRGGDWHRDPKRNTNLFEHFHGLEVTERGIAATRERVTACIENFLISEMWRRIRRSDPGRWRSVEELTSFDLGEFGAWVRIDFALETPEGDVWICDWKTGREEEGHRDQLHAYALYAHREWGKAAEQIRLVPAYLREGREEILGIEAEDLLLAERQIVMVCREMAAACDNPAANTASMDNFPKTDDRRTCARCFFQSVCFDEADWPCRS